MLSMRPRMQLLNYVIVLKTIKLVYMTNQTNIIYFYIKSTLRNYTTT